MTMFAQASGPTAKSLIKHALALLFDQKVNAVGIITTTDSINTFEVLFDMASQTSWFRGDATGTPISWTIVDGELSITTSDGIFALTKSHVWNTQEMLSTLGTSYIGTPTGATLASLLLRTVSPAEFGLVNDPNAEHMSKNTFAIQEAIRYLSRLGGGVVKFPVGEYTLNYGIWLFDNISIDLSGSVVTFLDANFALRSRACFVMGSSYEVNRDKAMSFYDDGSYVNNPNPEDTTYVNLALGTFLRDNQEKAECTNAHIYNGHIKATFSNSALNGAYAVNMANALYCTAHDLFFTGFTEAINMGSDTNKETPSCHGCKAYDLYVVQPDQVKTYYSIGFMANSTNCVIQRAIQYLPCADGTDNGSGVATNVVEDCLIEDIFIPSLGITQSSEGVLLNNAKGCTVRNICVRNCKVVVAVFYVSTNYISSSKWNHVSGVTGQGTVALIAVRGKYTTFTDFAADLSTPYEIYFGTTNGSNNRIEQEPQTIYFTETATVMAYWYCVNNLIKGWQVKRQYLRPAKHLLNDKSVLKSWTPNKAVAAANDTTLYFQWDVPLNVKAIKQVGLFAYFNTNSVAKASNIEIQVRRMVAYDGNANTAPYPEPISASVVASTDQANIQLTASASDTVSPGMVLMSDTTHGLANSLDVLVTFANTALNSLMKELTVVYIG